jgi:hypothetical protein
MKMFSVIALSVFSFALATGNAIDQPAETPERDMAEIRQAISGLRDTIGEAYESLLEDNPELSGDILVTFSITPDGSVADIEVTCDEGLESITGTVTAELAALDFGPMPGQEDNLPVSVPFTLISPE